MKYMLMLLTITLSTKLFAACGLGLTISNVTLPWTNANLSQQVNFTATRTNTSGGCRPFFITMTKGGSSTYSRRLALNSNTLNYNLYKNNSTSFVIKDVLDQTNANEVISASFSGSNSTRAVSYYVKMPYIAPPTGMYAGGTYSDTYIVKIFEGNRGNTTIPAYSTSVTVTTIVPKVINISLVDSGAAYDVLDTSQTLNFGTLTTGEQQGFDMRVLTNAGFKVSFSSQNNGNLKHASYNSLVSYGLKVNNVNINLAGSSTTPVDVATGSGIYYATSAPLPVLVTIGNITDKLAGSYSDYITVTATTTE
ncbi:MAG: spore coat protein U domain-containing protein [Bacteriovoracaceae bacterium]